MVPETGGAYVLSAQKGAWLCMLALLCPPISVASIEGCNSRVLLNVFLTLFGWLPGMWHAYYVVAKHTSLAHSSSSSGNLHVVQRLERLESGLGPGGSGGAYEYEYEYVIDYAGHRYRRDPAVGAGHGIAVARRVPLGAALGQTQPVAQTPMLSGHGNASGGERTGGMVVYAHGTPNVGQSANQGSSRGSYHTASPTSPSGYASPRGVYGAQYSHLPAPAYEGGSSRGPAEAKMVADGKSG